MCVILLIESHRWRGLNILSKIDYLSVSVGHEKCLIGRLNHHSSRGQSLTGLTKSTDLGRAIFSLYVQHNMRMFTY